ncbi:MAG TPA: PAS domain S-box protein [Nitrospira sp.]|nr:PAS domain S-box protein [Nitrospira sp.]
MTDREYHTQSSKLRRQAEQRLNRMVERTVSDLKPENVTALVHELQVHQIELEMQCHELRRAQAELEESRNTYRELYESIPIGYVTLDRDGRVYDINPIGETLLGWNPSLPPIRNFCTFFPEQNLNRFTLFCRSVVSEQKTASDEFEMKRADTVPFFSALQAGPVKTGNGQGKLLRVTFKDITSRVKAEQSIRRYQVDLEAKQVKLESLADQLILAQEDERRRIAGELHDDYCQRITALILEVSSLSKSQQYSSPSLPPQLSGIRAKLANILDDFRHLSHELHPRTLDTLPLALNLQSLTDEIASHSGLRIEFQDETVSIPLPVSTVICLYRLTQESLTNICKHAKATSVVVKIKGTSNEIGLCISDNGVGFHNLPREGSTGIGLTSMQERIRMVGGNISIQSRPGHGTTISAVIPLSQPS